MVSVQQLWKREYSNARYERWPNNVDPVQMAAFRLREKLRSISVLRPGQRILNIPGIGVSVSRRAVASGATGWWVAGGGSAPIAAYQAKGAASLAASYVNLANSGTYDAAPGVAPTLDASGWKFNGSTQYLTTGIVPKSDQAQTVLVRYSGRDTSTRYLFGSYDATKRSLSAIFIGATPYLRNGALLIGSAIPTAGVLAISGANWYIDGTIGANPLPAWDGSAVLSMFIGAINGVAGYFYNQYIQAFVYFDYTLSAPQVAGVSAAMAAL